MQRIAVISGLVAALFLVPAVSCGQSSPSAGKFDLFAGYSSAYAPARLSETPGCAPTNCKLPSLVAAPSPAANQNGFELMGIYKLRSGLGLAADFSGHFGMTPGYQAARPVSLHLLTFMAGPQFSRPGRLSPFGHVLIGGAYQSNGEESIAIPANIPVSPGPQSFPGFYSIAAATSNSVAFAAGGGIDLNLSQHFAIRVAQVDYLFTHFHAKTQNQPRMSAGLVFHF